MSNSKMTLGRAGLVTVATIFIIAVAVSNTMFRGMRLDLTENSLYTLSAGTKNILGNINEPINLYFFYSDRATAEISQLRTYAGRVREMLEEFVAQSGGRLRVTVIDPLPFSEDEDRAAAFGLQAISLGGATDAIYMGIAGTNSIDDVERITFLDPGKETFLEYELARLVDTLADPQRPVVGLISGLPIRGSFNPATQRRSEPWIVMTQIEQLFEIRELTGTTTTIDPEVNVLFVVHPKELPDATLYAIDQFILGGGRALLMVDPY
ncbi:MAG: GldG family protein, partial [Gammaproteobacteria bacterium]|nr:GldG family protein [Gammaproteobacteria bacterium]